MNNKIISKSERSLTNTIIIFIGIVLFTFFIILLNNNFQPKNNYEKNLKIIGFLVLALIIFYCIYYLLNQKRIYVYENYFEIKRILQTKKYHFSEITTHFSEYFEGKYNSWTEYYLILNTGEKITLIDSEYSNFYDFFSKIKIRVKENKKLNKKLSQPKFLKHSIICGIISCLMFYFSSCFYDFKTVKNSDFSYISSELVNDIKLIKKRKGNNRFEFELTNYPNFVFIIAGANYTGILDDGIFLKEFRKGTLVKIGIQKDEFEKKISKSKDLNFIDKYLRFSKIQVYQIIDDNNIYQIDNRKVDSWHAENNYWGMGCFSFLGLLFLFLAIGNYKSYIKSDNQINKNHT
ncbi:hypothetical protein [Flavobacterium polysaccharolyticum]|uniref:PH domain-containing protein n=1 Tax=Flavobacterium polysaccharolyticum TaxID=3133148 RepID=A0ABU9NMD5_9FLAO